MKTRLVRLAPVLLVLALAGWIRLANYRLAFVDGELIPQIDGDSSYHLHRTLRTIEQFPRVPHFDPEMNWPKGAFVPWADGFDLGGAAFAIALGGRADAGRARVAIALWPVLLGVLVVAAAMRLARVVAPGRSGRGALLAAGVAAALVPEGIFHSVFARIDHHVFEALVMTLLAAWALRRVPARRGVEPGVSPVPFEIEGALLAAMAVYGFTGSSLYVALASLPLAWAAFRDGRLGGSGAFALVAGGLLSALLSLSAIDEHHRWWSFQLPSLLQPAQLVLAGLGIALLAWCGSAGPARWRRLGLVCMAAVALTAAAVAWASGPVSEIRSGVTGWLLHRDEWIATIREFKPILGSDPDVPGWLKAYRLLGWCGFFLPVAMMVLALRVGRRSPRIVHLLVIAIGLCALTLLQNRFARVLVPVMAVVVGHVLGLLARLVAVRWRWATAAAVAPLVALVLFVADPPTRDLRPTGVRPPKEPWVEAALDLRDAPPPVAGRGVLTNWSYGHHVQALAGVPVVVNGFGSYLDGPEFWKAVRAFKGSAAALDAYLLEHRVGVVVAGTATVGNEVAGASTKPTFSNQRLDRAYMRSLELSPLLIAGSGVPDWNVPHLPHLMPRFASRGVVGGLAFRLPFVWGWERVAGAEVRGRAPPGARVVADLPFFENRRRHIYNAWTDAAPDGSWSMTIPFPSGLARPSLRSAPAWTISANGGAAVPFTLPEEAVRTGAVIDVGAVAGPAGRPPGADLAASAP